MRMLFGFAVLSMLIMPALSAEPQVKLPAKMIGTWIDEEYRPAEDRLNISPWPGRNLWLLGIWLEQNVLKKIPFHDRYKEFSDELTNAHVPELCLER